MIGESFERRVKDIGMVLLHPLFFRRVFENPMKLDDIRIDHNRTFDSVFITKMRELRE